MPRTANSLYFSGPGYGGDDVGAGVSSLARALFTRAGSASKAGMDAAHTDYYKALSAKTGIETSKLQGAETGRSTIADLYRQVPGMMAGKNAQGPSPVFANPEDAEIDAGLTQEAADKRRASADFFASAPANIAAAATSLPAAEQGRIAELFHFINANTPGTADASVARSLVGTGKAIGQNDAVSIPDREAVGARNQEGRVAVENIQSGDRRRGQDVGAETARRGQDVASETRSSIAEAVAGERQRNNETTAAERQRNNEATLAERQRNNETVAAERARANTADEELKRERAASALKVTPADYRRYANILADIGGDKAAGDTTYEPDAEAAIIGRSAELYRQNKDAVASTRQALLEIGPQLERRDSSWNPLSKRSFGLKAGGDSGIVSAATATPPPAATPAPAATPVPAVAPSTPGTGGSASGKHAPGSIVSVRGRSYRVEADGDTITPVQ